MKSIIYLVLVGQLWTNVITYCHWMTDSDWELVEHCNAEDSESEEDNRKELDDKFRTDLDASKFDFLKLMASISHLEEFASTHHPEVITPPPRFFLS